MEQGVSKLTSIVTPHLSKVLSGIHLTYLLYHSLASRASEVCFGYSGNVMDDNPPEENDGFCISVLTNVLSIINQHDGWSLCLSAWSICDGSVCDLLSNRMKRQMIDSGSILFGRGMKSYRVCNESDIGSVMHVLAKNRGHIWKESVVCVGQIINHEGQFVNIMYIFDIDISSHIHSPSTL